MDRPPDDASLDESVLAGLGSPGRGLFLTFEGLDRTGKSTQIELLAESLRDRDYDVLTTREPGGTKLGESVRRALLDVEQEGMSPRAESLLYAAARAQLVEEVVHPALEQGRIVLCDRYVDSSLAYQGYGRNLGTDNIITLNVWATNGLFPDLTILLLADSKELSGRGEGTRADRLEGEAEDFHERVRRGYQELLRDHRHRMRAVSAEGSVQEVQGRVRAVVDEEFGLFAGTAGSR